MKHTIGDISLHGKVALATGGNTGTAKSVLPLFSGHEVRVLGGETRVMVPRLSNLFGGQRSVDCGG